MLPELPGLEDRTESLDELVPRFEVNALLSPEHLYTACGLSTAGAALSNVHRRMTPTTL